MIFHYHLFPGGVTNVVTLSVRAILEHLPSIRRIRLVCGNERHLQTLKHHLVGESSEDGARVEFEVLPELYYLRRDAAPGDPDLPDASSLKQTLLERFAGAYWWIHNYHLGKNPIFTEALLEIAARTPEQPLLFHIHDFPECARYDNLELLDRFIRRPLYPTTPNVRYAVINSRDLNLLRAAGVPPGRLTLLNNPVPADHPTPPDAAEVRRNLEKSFAPRFPGYRPGAPLLFYPVRTIRRKNALEAGLIAGSAREPLNLIITLPGISEREAPYSKRVHECFERGLIPGMAGVGTELGEAGIGFQELALSTDCVVSSSVQEGFGYLFIDGRRWEKSVFARYLDILDGIAEIVDGEGAHFYRELRVPVGAEKREQLTATYRERAVTVSSRLPESAGEKIEAEIERAFARDEVDFSYLSVSDQLETLKKAAGDAGVRRSVLEANPMLFDELARLAGTRPKNIDDRIQRHFSLESFAGTLRGILESFEAPVDTAARADRDPGLIHENLKNSFAGLDSLRLLYE